MADEWSKPVKDEDGDWATRIVVDTRFPSSAMLSAEGLRIAEFGTDYAASAPRDVVLRLLAAEASDRLGWVWEVGGTSVRGRKGSEVVDWSVCPVDGIRTESDLYLFSPDDVLASLMGRFLLADAIQEAGQ